jgi:hypothetical protein
MADDEYTRVFLRLSDYRYKRQSEHLTLSLSDLIKLDDEIERLERRLQELSELRAGTSSRVGPQRSDPLGAEIEQAMRGIGDNATPAAIMRELKSYAGKEGSCVKRATADGVVWKTAAGEEKKLDMKALNKRLARRAKNDAQPR